MPTPKHQYRPLQFGVTRVTVRDGAPGVHYLQAEQALQPYALRMTDRLQHWAAHRPERSFMARRAKLADGTRELDVSMAVEDGDVTMVPKGYHPCATCHGYDLYYLNVMAGPVRTWKFHNAPEHEWLMKA